MKTVVINRVLKTPCWVEAKQSNYVIYVDGEPYWIAETCPSGQQIKAAAKVPGDYALYQDNECLENPTLVGGLRVEDDQRLFVHHEIQHFFAVPPATM